MRGFQVQNNRACNYRQLRALVSRVSLGVLQAPPAAHPVSAADRLHSPLPATPQAVVLPVVNSAVVLGGVVGPLVTGGILNRLVSHHLLYSRRRICFAECAFGCAAVLGGVVGPLGGFTYVFISMGFAWTSAPYASGAR